MRVRLLSQDRKADRLFREVLAGMPEVAYECAAVPGDGAPAEISVRDCDLPAATPEDLEPDAGDVFLLRPDQFPVLNQRYPLSTAAILLRPLKKAGVRALLERLVARRKSLEAPPPAGVDPRRGERDNLLEYLLLASLKVQQHHTERTNFIARALHDFRAPLTAVNGYCGLLLDEDLGALNTDQREILRRMQHSLQRLTKMANAMFELSLGRMVEEQPELVRGDITSCVEQAVYEIMPPADARDIEVNVDLAPPNGPLLFDASQIEQVLVNLLENACRFTPRRGAIEVRGYPVAWTVRSFRVRGSDGACYRPCPGGDGPNAYRVDVRDSGPGIPPDQIGQIFGHSVSFGGSHDRSGTGLGLATCRLIVNAHHGEVLVESRAEGATFSFVLPFIRPDTPEEELQSREAAGSCVSA